MYERKIPTHSRVLWILLKIMCSNIAEYLQSWINKRIQIFSHLQFSVLQVISIHCNYKIFISHKHVWRKIKNGDEQVEVLKTDDCSEILLKSYHWGNRKGRNVDKPSVSNRKHEDTFVKAVIKRPKRYFSHIYSKAV